MKCTKGEAGYLKKKKRWEWIRTIFEFSLVAAIFLVGYYTTKTRLNLLTVVAVLGCLPASKSLLSVIMFFPHHSIAPEKASEIQTKGKRLVQAYDMVVTSYEKIMPIDSIVVFQNIICGYSKSDKIDLKDTERYLKKTLANQGYEKVSVKIFHDYKAYVARVEGMERMAEVEKIEDHSHEEGMKEIILSLSM